MLRGTLEERKGKAIDGEEQGLEGGKGGGGEGSIAYKEMF